MGSHNHAFQRIFLPGAYFDNGNGSAYRMTQEEKTWIIGAIINCRNTTDETNIKNSLEELTNKTENLNIKPKGNKEYQPFANYFERNWSSDVKKKLWVKYHRRNLPMLIEDTTNGVESLFSAIKHYQKIEFGRRKQLTINQLVPVIMNIMVSNFEIKID